ncbi:hypothetical protein HNR62_002872 [Oceanisphaera litoralis]|uniref:hypothetical protein n=1 Tax=Oceanisphaera litoralis TaxID=225144 RepID=UPI00195779F8|nr:hypothetical protein [Oceanisphaera litoralis]MBM7456970.1 hypothetical protein [Oceanisphaera litoralis]
MKRFTTLAAVGCLATLTGCMSNHVKLHDYQITPIPMTEFPPSKQDLLGEQQKIVLLATEYDESSDARFAKVVTTMLKQDLMEARKTVVDRKLAAKMKKEIVAAEASGIYRTSGPLIAEIAVLPKVVSTSWGASFTAAESRQDDEGKVHTTPAYCDFTGNAKIYVRSYRIPSMELISTHEFQGKHETKSETNNSSCPTSNGAVAGLISNAVKKSIDDNSHELLNDFAPKGYVLERRDTPKGSKSLIRISVGTEHGAADGAKVVFKRKEKRINPLTDKETIEYVPLGEGSITNLLDVNGAWVKPKSKSVTETLRVGDVAELQFTKCKPGNVLVLGVCIPKYLSKI